MNTIEEKSSKFNLFFKKLKEITISFTTHTHISVTPKPSKESVLVLLPLIKSPKIQLMMNKMVSTGHKFTFEDEVSRVASFAIVNNCPEIIEELIGMNINLDQKIDALQNKTILCAIVQHPHLYDIFVKLIEAGAKTYCDSIQGSEQFNSNTLYDSVKYDEFLNISYLIKNNHCSYLDALEACYKQDKLHMLQYFLEDSNEKDIISFKSYLSNTPMIRQGQALEILEKIELASPYFLK